MLSHFPFEEGLLARIDSKAGEVLRDLNIETIKAISPLLKFKSVKGGELKDDWISNIFNYISKLISPPTSGPDSKVPGLNPEQFQGLMPIFWRFLVMLPVKYRDTLLQNIVSFGESISSILPTKKLVLNFLCKYFIDNKGQSEFKNKIFEVFKKWVTSLPKMLWDLGDKDPAGSTLILGAFANIAKQKKYSKLFSSLQVGLVPFFFVTVSLKNSESSRIFGPFIKLPPSIQKKAIDLLFYFDSYPQKLVIALANCANCFEVEGSTIRHLLQILDFRQELFSKNPEFYLNFLVSVLFGYNHDDLLLLQNKFEQKSALTSTNSNDQNGSDLTSKFQYEFIPTKFVVHFRKEENLNIGTKRKAESLANINMAQFQQSVPNLQSRLWRRRFEILDGLIQGLNHSKIFLYREFVLLLESTVLETLKRSVPIDLIIGIIKIVSKAQLEELPGDFESIFPNIISALLLQTFQIDHDPSQPLLNEFPAIFDVCNDLLEAFPDLIKDLFVLLLQKLQGKNQEECQKIILILNEVVCEEKLIQIISSSSESIRVLEEIALFFWHQQNKNAEIERLLASIRLNFRSIVLSDK